MWAAGEGVTLVPCQRQLRETTLVVFGNPVAGTPVMVAAPLAALDLPLKVLVWTDNR